MQARIGARARLEPHRLPARGTQVDARTRSVTTNVALTDDAVTRGLVLQPPPEQPRYLRDSRARSPERAAQTAAETFSAAA